MNKKPFIIDSVLKRLFATAWNALHQSMIALLCALLVTQSLSATAQPVPKGTGADKQNQPRRPRAPRLPDAPGNKTPAPTQNRNIPSPPVNRPTPRAPITPGQGALSPSDVTEKAGFPDEEPFKPTPPGARVTFNLEDADLPDLVRIISGITGKRFILPGKARSIKATIYAPTKVTAAEAYRAFLSILEINGMTVVPSGQYLKIVETGGIEKRPLTTYTEGEVTPSDDRYVTRLHRVRNVSADDVSQLLGRFSSPEGSITAYAPTNTLIITDTGTNLRRMLRILENIDVPRTGEQVWIEPVYYANASELAETLQDMFPSENAAASPSTKRARGSSARSPRSSISSASSVSPGTSSEGPAPETIGTASGSSRITKIMADDRTNSLILLATEPAYLRMLEVIRELDRSIEGEGRIHVHYLQHGDAEQIATTLNNLTTGGGSGGGAKRGANASNSTPVAQFEGQIKITAHEANNALVVTSSLHDYATLRPIIEKLDIERRQVFIEAVIMDLDVKRGRSLGISYHGGIPNVPEDGSIGLVGFDAQKTALGLLNSNNPAGTADLLTGMALGIRGPDIPEAQAIGFSVPAFGMALNAIANSSDANVLATPHLIATDNEEAEISIGQNVPLQNSPGASILGGLGGLTGGAGQNNQASALGGLGFGAVPRQDVGTTIRITPHVNESDEIRLEINEEISEAGAPSESASQGVSPIPINKRTAKTQLTVKDQQTVVIGGLMRDTVANASTKVPILGDIPLLGALFRNKSKTKQKANLLLFLTPYIIRSPADLRAIFERKMNERQQFVDRYMVFSENDYTPPMDYSRTRGLVAEIINEVDEIEADEKLRLEAEAEMEKYRHDPRSAVGAKNIASDDAIGNDDIIIGGPIEEQQDDSQDETEIAEPPAGVIPTPDAEGIAPPVTSEEFFNEEQSE